MYTVLVALHLIVCGFLIFIVLIQSSKGSELGAAFGGSSQTLFGSRGSATFMNKLTTGAAVVFMLSSLSLAAFSVRGGSVMPEKVPAQELPAQPLTEETSGPIQEKPAAQEQAAPAGERGEVQEIPSVP